MKSKVLSQSVADSILSMITIEKRFSVGDKLPNEIELSEELHVSRTTLREAIRILVAYNILEIRRGKGTYVTEKALEQPQDLEQLSAVKVNAKDLIELGKQAFSPEKYDKDIVATLPYYEEYFKQIIDIVHTAFHIPIAWLDIGCGTGKMADMAIRKLQVKSMVCCDNSPQMLKIAKAYVCSSRVDFVETSIQKLEYRSEFEVITAILVTHYLEYQDRIVSIQNCYNALKKNGLFFTVENFAPNDDTVKRLYLERWKNYQCQNGRGEDECQSHIRRYNREYFPITIMEQIRVLQKCGFRNVEIFWCSYMQVGILGIK